MELGQSLIKNGSLDVSGTPGEYIATVKQGTKKIEIKATSTSMLESELISLARILNAGGKLQ